jgi:bifunctional UDP-N-acetylglucosamine pyrophosphorylase/glucosamine-1-phosphate N-acetyltransferase
VTDPTAPTTGPVSVIVLAAGEGTRMRSARPKPLHMICGRPMVMHVIGALSGLRVERTVVVIGHGADTVSRKIETQAPAWAATCFVEQKVQRGTGDAAIVGLGAFGDDDPDDSSTVLLLPGDTPLLGADTLSGLVRSHESTGAAATVLTTRPEDPSGYGRIVRGRDGNVTKIVEERDADTDTRRIDEVNTGVYAFRRDLLGPALRRISNDNAQSEYYLTDVIGVLAAMGHRIAGVEAPASETAGVNDRWQLALAERELRHRINKAWLLAGVTMVDPRQTFIDVTVRIGRDVTLYPGTMLQGDTVIGDRCEIGPDVRLVDTVVGEGATVSHAVTRGAEIGEGATVGPWAHLGPGARVAPGADTGAFYTDQR